MLISLLSCLSFSFFCPGFWISSFLRCMYVGLKGLGELVVDHVLYVGDVQAPGRHIRGHQEPVLAGGEPVQVLETLLLMELGVKGKQVDIKKGEEVGKPSDADAVAEDHSSARSAPMSSASS